MKFAALALLATSVSATAQEFADMAALVSCAETACPDTDCCGAMEAFKDADGAAVEGAKDGSDADADIVATADVCALKATTSITFTGNADGSSAFACNAADGAAALKTTVAGAALALAYYMA